MKLSEWIHADIPESEPNTMVTWIKTSQRNHQVRKILEAIIYIWWWHIWKERNNVIHNDNQASVMGILNSIVSTSFLWISNRDKKNNYCWSDWIANPLVFQMTSFLVAWLGNWYFCNFCWAWFTVLFLCYF